MATNLKSIFISYARADGDLLAEQLRQVFTTRGYEVFLDVESIGGGTMWRKAIENAIENCTHFIAILTPKSLESEYFDQEWQIALNAHREIIPLKYKPCEVKGHLAIFQFIDFQDPVRYAESLDKLLRQIDEHYSPPSEVKRISQQLPKAWRDIPIQKFAVHNTTHHVHCIKPDVLSADAHLRLDLAKYRYRHLLVTETGLPGSKLLGVVSLRQLLKAQANAPLQYAQSVEANMDSYKTNEIDEPTFTCLHEDDTVETALNKFITPLIKDQGAGHPYYMSAIPLVDAHDNAVGIVSFKDLLKAMYKLKAIPQPTGHVLDWMRPREMVYAADATESPSTAKSGMRPLGQRDLPVLEEGYLVGLVPDHRLITHYRSGKLVRNSVMMTSIEKLKLQTPQTPMIDMLPIYVDSDYTKMYYAFPVVERSNAKNPGAFLGLVGYREIFRAVLEKG